MPRVHFVKKARKKYKSIGVKKGESYYWWKHRIAPRGSLLRRSKTAPRPSQLTLSEFWSAYHSAYEGFEDSLDIATDPSSVQQARDDFREALEEVKAREEEKYENMPEPLQQGETGQLLQERWEGIETLISELDGIEISDDDEGDDARDDVINELKNCTYNGS